MLTSDTIKKTLNFLIFDYAYTFQTPAVHAPCPFVCNIFGAKLDCCDFRLEVFYDSGWKESPCDSNKKCALILLPTMALKILLADDHAVVREGLRVLLEREGFLFSGEASDGREAIQLCDKNKPDIAVLDLSMPLLNGIDAGREIIKNNPKTKVILLTMHTEDHLVLESLRAGVTGYVLKTRASSELVQAIRAVSKGEMYLTQSISRTIVQAFLNKGEAPDNSKFLSDRERQVLQLVAEGKTTKELATILGISTKTAESHRSNIMEKLDIHDIAGLVRYAIRTGIIQN